jgi:hypothetical protein
MKFASGVTSSSLTLNLSNSRPLIVLMAGLLVFHQRPGRAKIAGTLVGFTQVRQFRVLLRANRTGKGSARERSAVQ